MSSYLSFVGIGLSVVEKGEFISITGISHSQFLDAMRKTWKTTKVGNNIFVKARMYELKFYKWYAIEIHFILNELLKNRKGYISARKLKDAIEGIEKNTWFKSTLEEHKGILDFKKESLFKWKLLPHQREFAEMYDKNVPKYQLKGYVLGASAGSGKTFNSLCVMGMAGVEQLIIVSPNNAIDDVWRNTIDSVYHKEQNQWVSNSKEGPTVGKSHYVIHYEYLPRFMKFIEDNPRAFKNVGVILDESHNFNLATGGMSNRTRAFIELCDKPYVKHVIWQSGTTFRALGSEAVPMFRTIDPMFTPEVEKTFTPIFGRQTSKAVDILAHRIGLLTYVVESVVPEPSIHTWETTLKNGKEFTLEYISASMRDYIKERLAFYEENMPLFIGQYFSLIEKVRSKIPEDELKKYLATAKILHEGYDSMAHKEEPKYCNKFELQWILPNLNNTDRKTFKNVRSIYKYYWLKVQGEALGRILTRERSRCSSELALSPSGFIERATNEKATLGELINRSLSKTVIFSNYVNTVEAIASSLREQGFNPLVVHGGTKETVAEATSRLTKDPTLDPLVTTYKSLSTAVPLIMTSNSIMVDQPFRDYERTQAIARNARLGQTKGVQIHDLYLDTGTEPNISTRSKDILEWSMKQVSAIMGRTHVSSVSLEGYNYRELIDIIAMEDMTGMDEGYSEGELETDVELDHLDLDRADILRVCQIEESLSDTDELSRTAVEAFKRIVKRTYPDTMCISQEEYRNVQEDPLTTALETIGIIEDSLCV